MCVERTKVQCFMNMKKMFTLSIRNMEREDIEICQITSKLIFRCNPRSKSGSEVCPPPPQHVLDVPLPFSPNLLFDEEINENLN